MNTIFCWNYYNNIQPVCIKSLVSQHEKMLKWNSCASVVTANENSKNEITK